MPSAPGDKQTAETSVDAHDSEKRLRQDRLRRSLSYGDSLVAPMARTIPWPKVAPPPLRGDRHGFYRLVKWTNWMKILLARHYNSVMTNALTRIVHKRAKAAVVMKQQLLLLRRRAHSAGAYPNARLDSPPPPPPPPLTLSPKGTRIV